MFSITGTIGLTSGELLVENNIEISGPGSDVLFIDSNAKSRVFHILPNKNVTISHLAIRNGKASGVFPDDSGAGIYIDHATAVIDDCTMTGNSADGSGGAIYNNGAAGSAALLVSNTTINTNSANQVGNGDGGGIFSDGQNQGTATMVIANSTVIGNSAAGFGGGIASYGNNFGNVNVLIINCTLSANSAQSNGGGIISAGEEGGSATLQISNTTLNDNLVLGWGGGILNAGDFSGTAYLQLTNCTLSGNSAQVFGGGICNAGEVGNATLIIANSTFSENSAGWKGGALFNDGQQFGSATVELGNTVLNAGVSGANISNAEGTVTSLGYNLSSDDGSSYLAGPGDQINTDPVLGPLQTNGGPTSTHALLSGSPAIDAGDPAFTPPPSDDQRGAGFDRVMNGRIDIGSFEVQVPMIDSSFTPRLLGRNR